MWRDRRAALLSLLALSLCLGLWHGAASGDVDVGQIAVINADGSIVPEAFDIDGRAFEFVPNAGGGYDVSQIAFTFEANTGNDLGLLDDGSSAALNLGFTFPFYGAGRSQAFVNANGNVTFGAASALPTYEGPPTYCTSTLPRIFPLWADLDPGAGGTVKYNALADRVIATWTNVPLFGTSNSNTFQVVLLNDGRIRMSYNGVAIRTAGVGISPGNCSELQTAFLDLRSGLPESIQRTVAIGQFFIDPASGANFNPDACFRSQAGSGITDPPVCIQSVARKFFKTHGDLLDQLVVFTNFRNSLGNAFAFFAPVRNTIAGIGRSVAQFNGGQAAFGSAGRLMGFLLIPSGATAPQADLTKLETIRAAWVPYFNTAIGGRGSVDTTLPSPVISVTPSSLDFGNVEVGRTADSTFTVQNSGEGTLSGTASVSAPFSITSGGSYDLTAGQSQTVTVRFSPTSAGTFMGSVTFTGAGGATRDVSGAGVAGPTFTLTVTTRGSAAGSVTSNPTGINCGATCSTIFSTGTLVTLTARPSSGATFREWGGACSGTTATCTVTMSAARSVTATFSKVFTDATLTAGTTLIKAAHITDLRAAINTLRSQNGLAAFTFTDATLTSGSTRMKRVHVTELRTALAEAYQAAGQTQPTYTDPTIVAGETTIKASHINELRTAVRSLE